ncbi:MAG: ABC transporter permease, partial [Anaerolineaceae bacterium]
MNPAAGPARKSKKNSQIKEIWRRFRKSKTAMIGLTLAVSILLIAVLADVITPYANATKQVGKDRLQAPNAEHWFGTDQLGRDLFARVVHGSRYSLMIGISTSLISLVIGGLLGAACGFYGGTLDNIIMRLTDVIMSVPPVLL